MKPISSLLAKECKRLLPDPEEQSAFLNALLNPPELCSAILWTKERPSTLPFSTAERLSWQPDFVDRIPCQVRPGQFDLHDQGHYYCLDFSSIFAAFPLTHIEGPTHSVLDMCASPGGKSIFALRCLDPETLVANEVIKKRLGKLKSNLQRCGYDNVMIQSRDSSVFAREESEQFDLVIVDAPCSGQSLLAKGEDSPGCFHPKTINFNSGRQRRICINAIQTVAEGGHFLYSTCTYSEKENEKVIKWLTKQCENFEAIEIPELTSYQSTYAEFPCYRMWPHKGEGAGSFTALLRRM